MPPTHTDSTGFIRILRGVYRHTDTTRHYTQARFRPQAQDMVLVDLVAACECEAYGDVSLTSSDSNCTGPSSKRAMV